MCYEVLMHIAVVAGGLSLEREVSLKSGRRVVDGLRRVGHHVQIWDLDDRLIPRLDQHDAEAAVIALHGGAGEDGTVQTILELADLPYVGTRSAESRAKYDKAIAKTRLSDAGILTPEWVALPSSGFRDLGATGVSRLILGALGLPLMVKPVRGGSALGAHSVRDAAQLPQALVSAYSYGGDALVEKYVSGPEVTVPVLRLPRGYVSLQPVLISPAGEYDYAARYDPSSGVRYRHLSDDDPDLDVPAIKALAVRVHEVLGLRHLSRIDMRFGGEEKPYVLEAAVMPGMTETSVWPLSVASAGLDLGQVFSQLLDDVASGVPAAHGDL